MRKTKPRLGRPPKPADERRIAATWRLPPDLLADLGREARKTGTTVTAIVEDTLRDRHRSVQISPALIDLAHQRAHRDGVTLAEVVEEALRGWLR